MVEVDAVDAVVAALVRPGRVLGADPQLHPHRGRQAARELHQRVRRPGGQHEAEGRPRSRPRRHPPVRSGGPRRPDRQAARRDARSRQAHRAEAARPGRGGPPQAAARRRVRRSAAVVQVRRDRRRTASRGSSRSRSPTPSSRAMSGSRATTPRRSATRWATRSSTRATSGSTGARSFLKEADATSSESPQPCRRRPRHLRRPAVHRQGQGRARRPASRRSTTRERHWTRPPRCCGRRPSSDARTPARPHATSSGAREEAAREERKDQPDHQGRRLRGAAGQPRRLPVSSSPSAPCSTRCARCSRSTPTKSWTTSTSRRSCCPSTSESVEVAGWPVLRGARRAAPPSRRHGDPARHSRGGGLRGAAVAVRQGALHREDGPAGSARALPARPEVRHGRSSTGRAIR